MKEEYSIEVDNIKKSFKIYYDKGHTLKETSLFKKRRAYEMRPVLNGISFKVKKGEAIALIGHNGCGKSTTLKMLTRILYPDEGSIAMNGRVSSLIELGAGFHPDMTGRENIFINASIFGLTHKEIEDRVSKIIEFSELEEFIDNPVRTYSSGMYMRLAFAVAINVDADILLIDEILAVGDAAFQAKCFKKMREIKRSGTTIVLVSHSMGQVEQLCDRCIWIHDGMVKAEGDPYDVDPQYLDYMNDKRKQRELEVAEKAQREAEKAEREEKEKSTNQSGEGPVIIEEKQEKTDTENNEVNNIEKVDENNETVINSDVNNIENHAELSSDVKKRFGNGDVTISEIKMVNSQGISTNLFDVEESCTIEVHYKVNKIVENASFGVQFFRNDGVACYGTNTRIERFKRFPIKNDGLFKFEIPRISLIAGEYWIDVAIESDDGFPIDYWKEAFFFEVTSNIGDVDIVRIQHKWIFE